MLRTCAVGLSLSVEPHRLGHLAALVLELLNLEQQLLPIRCVCNKTQMQTSYKESLGNTFPFTVGDVARFELGFRLLVQQLHVIATVLHAAQLRLQTQQLERGCTFRTEIAANKQS